MSQIFHRSTNTLSRLSIFGALFVLAFLLWTIVTITRSSYVTEAGAVREQPVQFSHAHHVGGMDTRQLTSCSTCHR